MSLLDNTCNSSYVGPYGLYSIFMNCKQLLTPPNLPAKTLSESCYQYLFGYCSSLINMPELPANVMAKSCYHFMFSGCTSLSQISSLPATKLADSCYACMFSNCSSLTVAPILPATELSLECYRYMFQNCTKLIGLSELPATCLGKSCYDSMFSGCTNLTVAPKLPAKSLTTYCYYNMFQNCTSLCDAPDLPATSLQAFCYCSMFYNCTSMTSAPELPAYYLQDSCYSMMFTGCSSLKQGPELSSQSLANTCYNSMFKNCTSLEIAPELPAKVLKRACYYNMFSGCTSLKMAPELPAETLVTHCYEQMFQGCSNLKSVKVSFSTWNSSLEPTLNWLKNVSTTGTFTCPEELDTTQIGVSYIPEGWTINKKIDLSMNSFIIERVKDYTNDAKKNFYDHIMNDDTISDEERFKRVNNFFHNMGLTDWEEGKNYFRDTNDERMAYLALTTNENWCADNYKSAINSNTALRSALYSSGLIFNMEWTDYLNPMTYVTEETPSIKKYKQMLLSYLDENQKKNEVAAFIKTADKLLGNGKNIVSAAEYDLAAKEIQDLSSSGINISKTEVVGVFKKYTLDKIDYDTGKIKISTANTKFNDYFKGVNGDIIGKEGLSVLDGVNIIATTAEDLEFILEICSQTELSEENRAFLDDIINSTDLPDDMRKAAAQVKKQYDEQLNTILEKLFRDFIDVGWDFYSSAIELDQWVVTTNVTWQIGGYSIANGALTVGDVGGAVATLKLGTWISNQFINAGAYVQKEASVEAYAYLAEHYVLKLRKAKTDFIENPNYQNAWEFYTTYRTLWNLRYQGEDAYRSMENVDGLMGILFNYHHEPQIEVASRNIDNLLSDYSFDLFGFDHPAVQKKYAQKIMVNCPVSVSIYDKNNILVATIKDGEESSVENQYGEFYCIYDPFTHDYKKVAYLTSNADCTVKCSATTSGLVSAVVNNSENNFSKKMDNIQIETNESIKFSTDDTNLSAKIYDSDGKETNNISMQRVDESTVVDVTQIQLTHTSLNLNAGDSSVLGVEVLPTNASNKNLIWKSDNPEVATVTNGIVTAISAGSANIICVSATKGEISQTCCIQVTDYLSFTAVDGNVAIGMNFQGTPAEFTLEYSLNKNGPWNTFAIGGTIQTNNVVSIVAGETVYLRNVYGGENAISQMSLSAKDYVTFTSNGYGKIKAAGNIMSLLDRDCMSKSVDSFAFFKLFDSETQLISAPLLPAKKIDVSCYSYMFSGCSNLSSVPELPATVLAQSCYSYMFSNCSSIIEMPDLSATKLASYCYKNMFSNCSNLSETSALPAKYLEYACYRSMFEGCTDLTIAPNIEASFLANDCCFKMFSDCTKLTKAPELKATTLNDYCYQCMFSGCTNLVEAPELPALELATDCYSYMFSGCEALKNAPSLPASILSDGCYSSMFINCISLIETPKLNATVLAPACYCNMFYGCKSLKLVSELPATILSTSCYSNMFNRCEGIINAPDLPAIVLADYCYYSMFEYCIQLEQTPELPATTLCNGCYQNMFFGCKSITSAPELPALTLAEHCYDSMFSGCERIQIAPELPAMILTNYCYFGMFRFCNGLIEAPKLSAQVLVPYCYGYMFYNCTNIKNVVVGFTDWSSANYTSNWLEGVSSSGTFICPEGLDTNVRGTSNIPEGWTVKTSTGTGTLILGDVNQDGKLDMLDARIAKRIAMKDTGVESDYNDDGYLMGDLDGNGKITINEARKIMRVVLGETSF